LAYLNYSRKKELRVVTHQAARKTRQITWLCPKVKGHSRPNYNLFGSDGWDVGDIPPHVDLVDEVEAFETLHPHSSEIDSNALGLCPAKDPKIVFFFWRGYGILGNLLGKHHLYQRFFLPCGRLPHGTAMDHTKWIRMVAKLLEVS
jgi:hypothetical protein